MLLKRYTECYRPAELQLASAGLLGNRATFRINRAQPIEFMLLVCDITLGATAPVLSAITTPQILDNIMGIVKRFELQVTDGQSPRPVVSSSGIGLLEWARKCGFNLDTATLHALSLSKAAAGGTIGANNLKVRITIPIFLVNPNLGEPLRTRRLLPCHTYSENPIVNIDFAATADFAANGTIAGLQAHLLVVRRLMSDTVTKAIQNSGGFIRGDLIESLYTVAPGVSGEQRFDIPLTGQYSGLLYRSYLGGAALTRDVLDQTTTFGSETVWKIMMGLNTTMYEFRWKDIHILNALNETSNELDTVNSFIAATSAGSPTQLFNSEPEFGGPVAANTAYRPSSSIFLDFLSDSQETADELGGLLDAQLPLSSGQDLALVGNVASVATNGSSLYLVGERFLDDLSKYQSLAGL